MQRVGYRKSFCTQNWTIKSQITLYSMLYIVFTMILTTSISLIFLNFSKNSLTESTNKMEQQETTNQMSRYNSLQFQSFARLLNFSYNTLLNINKLSHFVEKYQNNNFSIIQPTDCIDDPLLWDSYIFQCNLCYKFCNKSLPINQSEYTNYFNLISLMTQTLPILNLYRQTFFASTSYEQFFTVFKGGNYTTFVAGIRPWYINHLNRTKYETHQFYLSDLYLDWIKKLAIAFTVSLTNLKGDMIGVIGYDLAFDLMPNFVDQRIKMDIVNSTGHLLVSSYYEEFTYPTVIYNTSLTGLTEKDWARIKNFGDSATIGQSTLRVKNRKTWEMLDISVYKMQYPVLYIVIYQTDDKFLQYQQLTLSHLSDLLEEIIITNIYQSIIILFSVLLVQFITIRYVLSHLESLVLITKQQIFLKQKIKNKSVTIDPDKKNTISKLCSAFLKLNQNLTNFKWKKSKLCRIIQKINYPRKFQDIDYVICRKFNEQFKESIENIYDVKVEQSSIYYTQGIFKSIISRNRYWHKLFLSKFK